MATSQQIREGLGEAWDNLMDGWRKLYRRAAGAVTRFNPDGKTSTDLTRLDTQEIAVRSADWGVLACELMMIGLSCAWKLRVWKRMTSICKW